MPDAIATDLIEATGLDTRYVAIVWRQLEEGEEDERNGRPQLVLGGVSEFEAAGLLRSAVKRLEANNAGLIDCDELDESDEEDEDA